MSVQRRLDDIITDLTDSQADAEKADRGNKSAGVRVRKAAQEAALALKELRKEVITVRDAEKN